MSQEQPFSHPVNVRTLPKKGRRERYEAPQAVRAGIAEAYDLISVTAFAARAEIVPWKGRGVRVQGEITADLTQPCAATSEPLDVAMSETFEATYVPEGSRLIKPQLNDMGEMVLNAEGEDPPEVFTGDSLDLAEIWLEQFALTLDPFARVEGASLPESAADEEPANENPFAALAVLKGD